jgi:hypothetical protein
VSKDVRSFEHPNPSKCSVLNTHPLTPPARCSLIFRWVLHGTRVMLHVVKLDRSYGPETIAFMTAAFDTVCQSLSSRIRDDEALQRTIALAILRLADQGVRDPTLLADAAFRELAGIDRSAVR